MPVGQWSAAIAPMIRLVYGAIGDPGRWPEFLAAFCEATHADVANFNILYPQHHAGDVTCAYGISPEAVREYVEKWIHLDPWVYGGGNQERIKGLPAGVVLPSNELCPDEVLEELEVYKQFLRKYDLHYGAGMTIVGDSEQLSVLSTLRAKAKGPVSQEELAVWRAIFPYLRQAVMLGGEVEGLRRERDALAEYADSGIRAVFLVNQRGAIMRANAAGERMLETATAVRKEAGRLRFVQGRAQSWFIDALGARRGENGPKSAMFGFRHGSDTPIVVAVKAVGSGAPGAGEQPCAAVHVVDPTVGLEIDGVKLAAMLGLTRAEAALAAALARGRSMQEAAKDAYVSMNTVRTHLRHSLEKTGCHRQAELVALVLRMQ